MPRRIVVFGASGYTGRLVAAALVRAKARPVLAGRSAQNLAALGVLLGHGLNTAVANVTKPETLLDLIQPGDILVNTAGPFARLGRPVVEAAIERRATYIDACGEPAFIREVFGELGPVADQAGVALVPGFAHEFVAGNLAAALVLDAAGGRARQVHVAYFVTGSGATSRGTRSSAVSAAFTQHHAWRDGALATTWFGDVIRVFDVGGSRRPALAIGGSEHLSLPRLYPRLLEVGVYVGGPRSLRVAERTGGFLRRAASLPGLADAVEWLATRPRASDGPDEAARARMGSAVVAVASDADDAPLASVEMTGADPYTFTGIALAWAATRAATNGVTGTGALGPVEAFGLGPLQDACNIAGLGAPLNEDDNVVPIAF